MDTQLLAGSFDLLLYGMGVVFVFLGVLVFATTAMSRLIGRYFPEPAPVSSGETQGVDPLTRKIIQAAIDKHRGRH